MRSNDFIQALKSIDFKSYPRKIELTPADLATAGVQATPQIVAIINLLIKMKNKGATMHYKAEDVQGRTFLNRACNNGSWEWAQGKILTAQNGNNIQTQA